MKTLKDCAVNSTSWDAQQFYIGENEVAGKSRSRYQYANGFDSSGHLVGPELTRPSSLHPGSIRRVVPDL